MPTSSFAIGGYCSPMVSTDPVPPAVTTHLPRRPSSRLRRRMTNDTSALRGKPRFAGFAPTKAAQRILAESIAREVGPKGVHVAYLVIDAVIDLEWTRAMVSKPAGDPFFIQPSAIAEEVWHVAQQERSAWSFNVEIRPYAEPW